MNYSLELITLPAEAGCLLRIAQRDKRIFEHRKETLEIRTVNSAENARELQDELLTTQAELLTSNAIIESLPEGLSKKKK